MAIAIPVTKYAETINNISEMKWKDGNYSSCNIGPFFDVVLAMEDDDIEATDTKLTCQYT